MEIDPILGQLTSKALAGTLVNSKRRSEGGGIVLELAESFLPRECSGAERDGWGDDRGLAAKKRKRRKNRMGRLTAEDGRPTAEDGQRRVGRKEAQKAQESDGTADG